MCVVIMTRKVRAKLITVGYLTFLVVATHSTPPPGHKYKPPEPDSNPPKYEYQYRISNGNGDFHEKKEARDGIYALGRYHVKDPSSSQRVEYLADDWGYHPYVEYSNVGPHSKTSAQIILGKESVIAQQKNREEGGTVPVTDDNRLNTNTVDPNKDNRNDPPPEKVEDNKGKPKSDPPLVVTSQDLLQGVPENLITPQVQLVPITEQIPIESLNQVFLHPDIVSTELAPSSDSLIFLPANNLVPNQQTIPQYPQISENTKQNQILDTPVALPLIQEVDQSKINQNSVKEEISNEIRLNQVSIQNTTDNENNIKIEEIKETSPLFENGAEISENLQEEQVELLGSFGQKIQPSNTASKLIQSTKDLITEMDVLNINDAADIHQSSSSNNEVEKEAFDYRKISSKNEARSSFNKARPSLTGTHSFVNEGNFLSPTTLIDGNQPITPLSLLSNPIVVEDFTSTADDTQLDVVHHEEERKNKVKHNKQVVVTPRPSTKFLAPITAGVQLQNVEHIPTQKKIVVEIQKSIPYYIGKYEYSQSGNDDKTSPLDHYKLGQSLITFPTKEEISTVLTTESVEQNKESKGTLTNNLDQQEEQGTLHHVHVSKEKSEEKPKPFIQVLKPVQVTKYVDRPYPVHVPYPVEKIVEKYINRPYPIHVPIHVPVTVEKKVHIPYPVEKIIEKPVEKIIEKAVPQPYPVEKIIEKKIPIEVTKFVDRPYPVQVPIPQPYPVEKIVNKPYPVAIQVPILIPHQVNDKKLNNLQLPVAEAYHYLPSEMNNPQTQKVKQYFYSKPYVYVNSYQTVPKNHQSAQENTIHVNYANPPANTIANQYIITPQNYNGQYVGWNLQQVNCKQVDQNQYIGLVPPKNPALLAHQSKKRQAKEAFESPRLEYGFLPPLIPSQEIDEQGRPINS